jgi:hypothetical protein
MSDRPRTVLEGVYGDDLLNRWEAMQTEVTTLRAQLATIEQIAQRLADELRPYRRGQLSDSLAAFDAYQKQKAQ